MEETYTIAAWRFEELNLVEVRNQMLEHQIRIQDQKILELLKIIRQIKKKYNVPINYSKYLSEKKL